MKRGAYWVKTHLRIERRRMQSYVATERFNERLNRIRDIQNDISEQFVDEVIDDLNSSDLKKLMAVIDDMQSWKNDINENIDIAKNSDLSKYATRVKKTGVLAIKLCKKYAKYSDIDSVEYIAKEKEIHLNGKCIYYLG